MHPSPDATLRQAGRRRLGRALRWRLRRARSAAILWLTPDALVPQIAAARVLVDAEVVLYYADSPGRLYQLDQWIPVLEQLSTERSVLLVLRSLKTMREVQERTSLPVVCITKFIDLMNLYDLSDFKVGIYVNHGRNNFQSLNNPRMLHVHVNHGESDKLSSFSNQVKAYDRVFVAGPVAVDRYREALIAFDHNKLVMVGLPQLDLTFAHGLPESSRRTVMYAPTWEGESESNNWTSLDRFGVGIVESMLALPDVRVIYKPHPRVAASRHPGVSLAHGRILELLSAAGRRDPEAGHLARMEGDILAMFSRVDALVGDISSVTLDFLYMRPECPLFLTDRRDDRTLLEKDSPLAAGADIIDSSSMPGFGSTLASRLTDDTRLEDRIATRERYFGDLQPGDSTKRFQQAVAALVAERDELLVGHRRVTTGDVDEHG